MAVCPSCDSTNPEDHAFCGHCGSPLSAGEGPRSHPVAERKLATVLFADVVGFTSLAERADPEVVAHLVDTAFRRLGETVEAYGGTVDKFMGDSVMAVFGVPTAHDDDAERAVAAALAMRDLGGDLAFSIGVNTGEVMATDVGRAGDRTVIGDAVNVAARLEQAAGPGEVLCGRLTVELARRRIRFREHETVLLKGKREPVEVYVAESVEDGTAEPAVDGPGLVGRGEELEYLLAQWQRVVKERRSRVLLLTGDAGSGKTRLAKELTARAQADGLVVSAAYPAYGAMGGTRMAREIARQLGPAGDAAVDARVRSVAGQLEPSLGSIAPERIAQEQLWAFVRLLKKKADRAPILMALDDMQCSDDRTTEILSEIGRRLGESPVLMLLIGRDEPARWTSRLAGATSVRLGPLGRSDAAALAAALVPERPLTPDAIDFLVERSSGNPLYLRELVAMARDRELFEESNGCYALAAYGSIPATLHSVLAARLDALEAPSKRALQHVAVLGEQATAGRVEELGTPEAHRVLELLVSDGLLTHGPNGTYATADLLLREVAYETLPRNTRGELHRVAAGLGLDADERARHLDRAAEYLSSDEELALQAAEALADEGESLAELSRHVDAVRVLERALELGCRRPTALLALARMLALAGSHERALSVLELIEDDADDPSVAIERDHTAANSRAFDDPAWATPRLEAVALRWHALGNTVKEAWAYSNAGVTYFNTSRFPEAVAALERALALFESVGDEAGAVASSSFLCLANPADERVPEWLDRALAYADAVGDRGRQLATLSTLSWNRFFRSLCGGPSDVAEVEQLALRLVGLAEELGAFDLAVNGWSLLVVMARLSGRMALTADRAAELRRALGAVKAGESWLGWAASFSAAVAAGLSRATPPFPPEDSADPVLAMARLVIEIELILSGRAPEALEHDDREGRRDLGVISDLLAVFHALALIVAGRAAEAQPLLSRSRGAAIRLGAASVTRAAAALEAELAADPSLAHVGAVAAWMGTEPLGLADVLELRARVACGDSAYAPRLNAALEEFAAPGLALER